MFVTLVLELLGILLGQILDDCASRSDNRWSDWQRWLWKLEGHPGFSLYRVDVLDAECNPWVIHVPGNP
jgi:hypothetical protein